METGDETEGTMRYACKRGMTEKSAVVEHTWDPIHWEETTVLDHGRGQELFAHPDGTLRGELQPSWMIGSPWLLDCCDKEAGRSNPL